MASEDKRVGENIKSIRTRKGLTQQEVADLVGVKKQAICKIEKTGNTSPKTLNRIAELLNVDVSELYEPVPNPISAVYADFINDAEIKVIFSDSFKPVFKKVNDTVAERFYDQILKTFSPQDTWARFIKKHECSSPGTYTSKQVYDFCDMLRQEFKVKAKCILRGVDIEEVFGEPERKDV